MLATLVPRPFHKPNWVYEEKYDGIRILAYKEGNKLYRRPIGAKAHSFLRIWPLAKLAVRDPGCNLV